MQALRETNVLVQFAKGLETKRDKKGVMAGQMLALENAIFSKSISFQKRNGYEELPTTVLGSSEPLPTPIALGRRQYELLAFTGSEAYSFVDDASAWIKAGDIASVICDHEPAAKTGSDQTRADMDVLSGIAAYAWEDSRGGVYYAVLDDYTMRAIVPPTLLDSTGSAPRVHAVGSFLHVYWVRSSSGEIRVRRIDPLQPTTHQDSVLLTTIDGANPLYDIDADSEKAVIAWRTSGSEIGVGYVHQEGSMGGTGLGLPIPVFLAPASAPETCLAVAIDKTFEPASSRRVALLWSAVSGLGKWVTLTQALATEYSINDMSGGAYTQATVVFLRDTGESGFRELYLIREEDDVVKSSLAMATGTNPFLATYIQLGHHLGGKAFLDDGEAYVVTLHASTLFTTYFLQRARELLPVARFLPGIAGGVLEPAHLPSVTYEVGMTGRAARFAAIYATDVESPNGDVFTEKGIRRVSFDFASDDAFRSAQLGKTAYVNGGFLWAYDGERFQEAGFHYGPDDIATPTLGAAGGIADGTYGYVAVYENILANGEVERGPASPVVLVTVTGGPRQVTLQIPTYRFQTKPRARIGVYRSENGDAAVFSRVSSLDPNTEGDVNGYVANSVLVNTVSFTDSMPDSELVEQEPLYTNGGIPANDPLGSVRLIAGGKGRLFLVDSSEPNRVYFTQEQERGYAAEQNPGLFLDVDPYGGDVNGLIVMDDVVYPFKETAIFGFAGPGPLANPEVGGGFSSPELVTSDVGCLSPDSLGYTPVGTVFQSRKGHYILARNRAVEYIGAPVEAFNSQLTVAATLIEDKTQIRFLTDSGKTLLFDYREGQWSTFLNHEGLDAVVVDGEYFYLRTDGRIVTETPDSYRDVNSQIRMGMETAWLKLAGHLQGWQFLWFVTVIGEFKSTHTLRVYTGFDYEDGWTGNPIEVDPMEARATAPFGDGAFGAGVFGGTNDTRYQFVIHVGAECEAVRFRFEDVEPADEFGASFELSELILTGGVARTDYTLEESRRY